MHAVRSTFAHLPPIREGGEIDADEDADVDDGNVDELLDDDSLSAPSLPAFMDLTTDDQAGAPFHPDSVGGRLQQAAESAAVVAGPVGAATPASRSESREIVALAATATVVTGLLRDNTLLLNIVDVSAFMLLCATSLQPEAAHYWVCALTAETLLRFVPLLLIIGLATTHVYWAVQRNAPLARLGKLRTVYMSGSAARVAATLVVIGVKIREVTIPAREDCADLASPLTAAAWVLALVITAASAVYTTVWLLGHMKRALNRHEWAYGPVERLQTTDLKATFQALHMHV